MQRQASEQSGEASVTVVHLPSDELKGRIIGREGRNIRALEAATGVDVIVDDTPEAIVLSSFDPVRREVARATLERLFSDGRIHPARIEEMVVKARNELAQQIKHEGEQACQDIGLTNVHPELARLLGTLRYRNSYGHNVLSHSQDTAAIAGMIAAEIGFDEQIAKEAALFHDIGKAVEHDVDGPHAIVGGEILARLGRPAAVVQAVRSHHYDEEPRSPAAAILMTADAISAARPGARRELLASTIKRLERIEAISNEFRGVETKLRRAGGQGASGSRQTGRNQRRRSPDHGPPDRQASPRRGELQRAGQGGRPPRNAQRRVRQVTIASRWPVLGPAGSDNRGR